MAKKNNKEYRRLRIKLRIRKDHVMVLLNAHV